MANWYDGDLDKNNDRSSSKGGNWYDQYLDRPIQTTPLPKPKEEMGPMRAGLVGSTADLLTTGARIAHGLGMSDTGKDIENAAESRYQSVKDQYHPKVPTYEDIHGVGDAFQYIYETGAQSLPQMAALAGAGALGAMAAPAAVPGAIAGLGAAALADVPFFTGSNLRAQQETGKKLPETSLGTAAAAAIPQSLLDVALGEVLPGVGRAARGGILSRALKKTAEGTAIEGLSEGAQQAIEIGQADPDKLSKFGPDVQKEVLNALIAGGALGGILGGGAGALQKRYVKPASASEEDQPDQLALPAPDKLLQIPDNSYTYPTPPAPLQIADNSAPHGIPNVPINLGGPTQDQTQTDAALSPSPQTAGTTIPGLAPSTGMPGLTEAQTTQMAFGTPQTPSPGRLGPLPGHDPNAAPQPFQPEAARVPPSPTQVVQQAQQGVQQLARVVPDAKAKSTGQQVYKDIQQKLLAMGMRGAQVQANASLVRDFYQRMATRLKRDAWDVYKDANLQFGRQSPDGTLRFNQSALDNDTPNAEPYSKLWQEIHRIPMKSGTAEQWINALKRQGVKPDEIKWSPVGEFLNDALGHGRKIDKSEILDPSNPWAKPFMLNRNEAVVGSNGGPYSAITLGNFGEEPESNYRAVVLSLPKEETRGRPYEHSHWPGVVNPIVHYRTTDRVTSDGKKVTHGEEIQSDVHQAGRERGYAPTEQEMLDSEKRLDDGIKEMNRRFIKHEITQEQREAEFQRLTKDYHDLRSRFARGVPDAPMKHTWPTLAMKHLIMDAINAGHDSITWNTGDIVSHIEGGDFSHLDAFRAFYDKTLVDIANKLGKPFGAKVEKVRLSTGNAPDVRRWQTEILKLRLARDKEIKRFGRSDHPLVESFDEAIRQRHEKISNAGRGHEVHSLKIPAAMRELVRHGGYEYFQKGQTKKESPRAGIDFLPDKTVITLLKDADASSLPHELGHLFLQEMTRYAKQSPEVAADLKETLDWMGVSKSSDIKTEHHEKFARAFERYLSEGKAPTKGLKAVFERFAKWIGEVYKQVTLSRIPLSNEMRGVFDRLLGGTERTVPAAPKAAPKQVRSAPKEAEYNPGRMPTLDRETFSQGPVEQGLHFDQAANSSSNVGGPGPSIIRRGISASLNLLKNISDPLSRVPESEKYLDLRNLAAGQIAQGEALEKTARNLYAKAPVTDWKAVNEFLIGNAPITSVPTQYRAQTARFRHQIDALGQKLVDRGLLHPETYEAGKGKYLPRLYLMHMLKHGGITGAGLKANLTELMQRKNLSLEARLALGQVEHPSVTVGTALTRMTRDVAAIDFMGQVYQNNDWALPKSTTSWEGHRVTPEWLAAEAAQIGDVDSKGTRAHAMAQMDPAKGKQMEEVGKRMRTAAHNAKADLDRVNFDPKEWKQLPDRPQYGMLRGAWVRTQIADDITGLTDFVNDQSWAARTLGDKNSAVVRLGQMWKSAKVPWNIGSQARNFVSNIIQAHLIGGVNPARMLPNVVAIAREIKSNGPWWELAKKWGMTHGTMAESELHALADMVAKGIDITSTNPSKMAKLGLNLALINSKVTGAYGAVEALFKAAVMKDAIERRGMAPNEAARLANRAIADYSMVHPSIRYLRNAPLGIPFITYYYKMLPELAKTLATKQGALRFVPYVAFMAAAPAIVAGMNKLEPGDDERLRKALSEGLRRQNNMFLLPFKDANGRWQFVDMGYFFPWQMPQDVATSLAKGHVGDAVKSLNLFSNPVISAITAMSTGIDPFTQRPIADKRDPLEKQVMDITAYVWGLAMPSFVTNYGAVGKALESMNGTGLNRYGEPNASAAQIAARLFGVNVYPIDAEAQRARNLIHMQSEIQQVKSRMTYSLKDQSLTPEQRKRVAVDFVDKIKDLSTEMAKYAAESAMTPSLRAASARP